MTHADWMNLLAPVLAALVAALALPLAALLGLWLTGLTAHLKAWLVARNQVAAAQVVGEANTVFQAAVMNGAGRLVVRAQAGELDLTDLAAVKAEAVAEAPVIAAKIAGALLVLAPTSAAGDIADGVVGKLGLLVAPAAAGPVVLPAAAAA